MKGRRVRSNSPGAQRHLLRSPGPELLLNALALEEGLPPPGTEAIGGLVLSSKLLLSTDPHLHSANLKTKKILKQGSHGQP